MDRSVNTVSLQAIATSVAQERYLPDVLQRIVTELAAQPNVALTRIWLLQSGEVADGHESSTGSRTGRHLTLAASAGTSCAHHRHADWSRVDGARQHIELGTGKVGRIGATGESILVADTSTDQQWIVDQHWAHEEGIQSFAGHPLMFRGEILGVLALFSRDRLTQHDFDWLRLFADQAAVAIANARAFEEIEHLRRQLESENFYLREEVNEARAFGEIVGSSPALAKTLEQIELVAPTMASVLILGESGTGKELVARAIHERSQRRERPLVKVNCAAVPRDLFESEFFGHVKGSFTGAVKDRTGRFQLADRGTLFLDEVGEIPLELQGKLLRVLQEGQIERVGDDVTRRVDVRVIAATNRDLRAEVEAGRFRQDLFFRLSVFPIEVVPLRERREDIPALAELFLKRCCRNLCRDGVRLAPHDLDLLQQYAWPGNVRELQNVIERAAIGARQGTLDFSHLLPATRRQPARAPATARSSQDVLTRHEVEQFETANIAAALERTNWKIYGARGAAALLGMQPTTLASRMKRLGLHRPR
ncbi:MAG: sigma 54-interacting transcriptional regulator [Pirellulales bacterium]|nr:sigma 54-interacting transcriptional regulator [Pirellulales bacterium]